MTWRILALAPLALAACLPTKTEPYHCANDRDCLTQVGVSHGLRCDLARQICVCDGPGAPGCATPLDGGSIDTRAFDASDAPSSDVAMCASSIACPAATPICSASGSCVPCATTSQCAALGDAHRAACSPGGACVECVDNSTCGATSPLCDPARHRCVDCLASASCPADAPICSAGLCTACAASVECAALNDPARTLCSAGGACVGCLSSATCPATAPVCAPGTGACRVCTSSAECTALDPKRPSCSPSGLCVQCTDSSTCSAPTPVCDAATSTCVECVASATCPASAPICSPAHTCGACASPAECSARDATHPACSTSGTCVECIDGSTCSTGLPVCDASTHTCVRCLVSSDCAGTTPICAAKSCVRCSSSAECKGANAALPACAATGACVECTDSSTCSGGKSVCDTSANRCVQCLTNSSCSGVTPICSAAHVCAGCSTAAECFTRDPARPACSPAGACVECTDNAACSAAKPICDTASNVCRACTADSECAVVGPGVCMSHQDGRCASDAETIVVTSSGTFPAIVPAGKHLLVVRGSVPGTIAWSLGSAQMTIVGQNRGTITGNGVAATVHLDGGDTYLRNLTLTTGAPGLWADGGAVVRLDHVNVSNNSAGGILLDGAGFDIKNTSVTGNAANTSGSAVFGGLRVQSPLASPRALALSTISANQLIGITCDTSTALNPSPTSVLVVADTGAVDIAGCGFTSCATASATCGAQP